MRVWSQKAQRLLSVWLFPWPSPERSWGGGWETGVEGLQNVIPGLCGGVSTVTARLVLSSFLNSGISLWASGRAGIKGVCPMIIYSV